jgi:hypothetical protein
VSACLVSQPVGWIILESKQDSSPFGFDLFSVSVSLARRGVTVPVLRAPLPTVVEQVEVARKKERLSPLLFFFTPHQEYQLHRSEQSNLL